MLRELFELILGTAYTASFAILAVLLIRLLLRRAPRVFSYALWIVVLIRLCCPVLPQAAFGLIPDGRAVFDAAERAASTETTYPAVFGHTAADAAYSDSGRGPAGQAGQIGQAGQVGQADQAGQAGQVGQADHRAETQDTAPAGTMAVKGRGVLGAAFGRLWDVMAVLWLAGFLALLAWGAVSYFIFMKRIGRKEGQRAGKGEKIPVIVSRQVYTPFAAGVLRPVVYLPAGLEEAARDLILEHERVHIRRLDIPVKMLAWAVTCIYWFHPLVWLSFFLMERDMELSCDEAVLRRAGEDKKKAYARALLSISRDHAGQMYVPIAFGEKGVKERIRNVVRWKKAGLWGILAAAALVGAATIALSAGRRQEAQIPTESGVEEFAERETETESETYADKEQEATLLFSEPFSGEQEELEQQFGVAVSFLEGQILISETKTGERLAGIDVAADENELFLDMRDENNGALLYTSTPAGGQMVKLLYVTQDRWAAWRTVDVSDRIDGYPTGLCVLSDSHWYVSTDMRKSGYLFETTDGGESWTPVFCDGEYHRWGWVCAQEGTGTLYMILEGEDGEIYSLFRLLKPDWEPDAWENLGTIVLPGNGHTGIESVLMKGNTFYLTDYEGERYALTVTDGEFESGVTEEPDRSLLLEDAAANADVELNYKMPIEGARVSDGFGEREDPLTGAKKKHNGIDLAAKEGTPIHAAAAGTVFETGFSPDAGNYVILHHANGEFTYYLHCSEILTERSDQVEQGDQIATVGSTGRSTGPHLCFARSRGKEFVEPLP